MSRARNYRTGLTPPIGDAPRMSHSVRSDSPYLPSSSPPLRGQPFYGADFNNFDYQDRQPHTAWSSTSSDPPFICERSRPSPPRVIASRTGEEFLNDPVAYVRNQFKGIIALDQPLNIYSIPDPPNRQKPTLSLPMLVKILLVQKPLTLKGIYEALIARFEWFKDNEGDRKWKDSIRHNLSLNKVFVKQPRPGNEPGRGDYWTLVTSAGEGYTRPRSRKPPSSGSPSIQPRRKTSPRSRPATSDGTRRQQSDSLPSTPIPSRPSTSDGAYIHYNYNDVAAASTSFGLAGGQWEHYYAPTVHREEEDSASLYQPLPAMYGNSSRYSHQEYGGDSFEDERTRRRVVGEQLRRTESVRGRAGVVDGFLYHV